MGSPTQMHRHMDTHREINRYKLEDILNRVPIEHILLLKHTKIINSCASKLVPSILADKTVISAYSLSWANPLQGEQEHSSNYKHQLEK